MKKLKPYEMIGTPDPGTGTRILSAKELARKIADNPLLQKAIETINRAEGKPRMIQRIISEMAEKNSAIIAMNKFQIDAQLRKQALGRA